MSSIFNKYTIFNMFNWKNVVLSSVDMNNIFQSFIIMAEAYYWRCFNKPVNLVDKFIFVSKFIKNKHIEFDKNYLQKAEHLYNFSPEAIDKEITFKKAEYFLFFGRLSYEKGIKTLIDAFLDCKADLIIAGNGEFESFVKDCSMKYNNIKFVGFKSGIELDTLIKNAFYVVVPSEWYENNPMSIIEAYKLCTPVIGARIGGIPEIIIDGKTGFLFDSKDKNDLVSKIKLAKESKNNIYKKMCLNAFDFANNNFNSQKHYETLMQIYNNTIKIKK